MLSKETSTPHLIFETFFLFSDNLPPHILPYISHKDENQEKKLSVCLSLLGAIRPDYEII